MKQQTKRRRRIGPDGREVLGDVLVALIFGLVFAFLFSLGLKKAYPQEWKATWPDLQRTAARPDAFDWWCDLNGRAPQSCRVTYYHPREAGRSWGKWKGCRVLAKEAWLDGDPRQREWVPGPGGLVRPGVACVASSAWRKWGGKLLWIRGEGLYQCVDADGYRGGTYWFDLARGAPWTYDEWLWCDDAVACARKGPVVQRGRRFVVLDRWPAILGGDPDETTPTETGADAPQPGADVAGGEGVPAGQD